MTPSEGTQAPQSPDAATAWTLKCAERTKDRMSGSASTHRFTFNAADSDTTVCAGMQQRVAAGVLVDHASAVAAPLWRRCAGTSSEACSTSVDSLAPRANSASRGSDGPARSCPLSSDPQASRPARLRARRRLPDSAGSGCTAVVTAGARTDVAAAARLVVQPPASSPPTAARVQPRSPTSA
jgi:hypothetical protein